MSDIQLFNGEVNQHENTKNYNNDTVFGQLDCVDEWHCPREGAKWCCEGLHCVKRHIVSHITSTPLYHDLVINCFFLMWHYTGSKSQLLISPTVTLFHHDSADLPPKFRCARNGDISKTTFSHTMCESKGLFFIQMPLMCVPEGAVGNQSVLTWHCRVSKRLPKSIISKLTWPAIMPT